MFGGRRTWNRNWTSCVFGGSVFLWASEPLLNKIKYKCLTDFQSCYLAAIPVSNAEMAEAGIVCDMFCV